ncbi:MAG: DUF4215 domain-containing protein [Myxococcales bacterium]|nr:DUF4215 domain-containing protein [Myxococcales bacterium]
MTVKPAFIPLPSFARLLPAMLALSVAAGCGDDSVSTASDTDATTTTTTDTTTTTGTSTTDPSTTADTSTTTTGGSESDSDTTTDTTTSETTGGCTPGTENCPCDAGACDAPLVCEADVCVTPPPIECGNGVMERGEECDDGDANGDTMACKSDCTTNICGDTFVYEGVEECDDGNDNDLDGCSNTCVAALCGDNIKQENEECDDGNMEATDACTSECLDAVCGDSFVYDGFEECDDGDANGDMMACKADCTDNVCGDGFLYEGVEECDDGDANGDTKACKGDCTDNVCGDGFTLEGVEECDDGNTDDGDGCSANCTNENCFSFTNTDQEDLMGADWFDACVDAVGNNVEITVRDPNDQVIYQASGTKVGSWSYDQLTSTASLNIQYNVANHDRIIKLDNGDLLRISGKNSSNSGCGGSQGNGYVIMTYDDPINSTYYNNIKLLVAPYLHTVGNNNARNFGAWTPGGELSWNNDMNMFSCFPNFGQGPSLTPYIGSFSVRVY